MSVASVNMQIIDLSALRAGTVLPTPIFDANNPTLLLLGEGTKLTEQRLTRLKLRGITRIIIDSKHVNSVAQTASSKNAGEPTRKVTAEDIRKGGDKPLNHWMEPPKPVPPSPEQTKRFERMREMQELELQETLSNVTQGSFDKTSKLKSLSVDSCEMMLEDLDLFVKLAIDRKEHAEVYGHCLRTAQLAMAVAAVLGKSCENISDLGMGCLIARAGQSDLAKDLIQAPRALTDSEWVEIKRTPSRTFDLMEQCPDVPVGARQVAYQMFERWDGSGYPRGRVGTQIHPLSRIASVADAYVALTSGRAHRPPFSPYRAIEIILMDTRKGLFDPQTVRGLLQTVCLYPVGSRVRLSDNSRGMVLRTKAHAYDRPLIQLTHGPDGCSVPQRTIDLSDTTELAIVDVIDEEPVNSRQLTLAFEAY